MPVNNDSLKKEIAYQNINAYINNLDKEQEPIQQLIKIIKYIEKEKLDLTYEEYVSLIKENQQLETLLKNITQPEIYNKLNYILSKPTYTFIISSLIDSYCLLNDIPTPINELDLLTELQNSYTKQLDRDYSYPYEYLQYVRQIPKQILTKEEEQNLFLRLRNGDIEVKQELIERNLLLVVKIANHYYNIKNKYQILDLIQEGNIGLIHAINKFDISKGYKFSTYATFWIKEKIYHYLVTQTKTIKVPEYKYIQEKYNRCQTNYSDRHVISNYHSDEKLDYYDMIEDNSQPMEELAINKKMQQEVQIYLEKCNLNHKYLDVLNQRFGLNQTPIRTYKAISEAEGVTQEAIRQREKIALSKLQKTKGIEFFAVYMNNPDTALTYLKEHNKEKRGRPRKLNNIKNQNR